MDLEANYERDCPGCGETFIAKRLNQKFCEPLCKSQFHNNKSRRVRLREKSKAKITGEAHAILWKNREILAKHIDDSVSLATLEAAGFKTNNITQFQKSEENKNEFLVYDIWYQITKTDSGFEFKIYKK